MGISDQEPETKGKKFKSLRLAVVPEGFPDVKLTEEQAEVVETALVEKINPFDRGQPIQFSETQYENGALVLTCVNLKTYTWLRLTVQKIVPWPGVRLELGLAESTLKGSKLIMWVNDKMGVSKKSYQQILELIQKQNKDISTTDWRVIRGVAETDTNERLVLWVDNKSFGDLKAHFFKLFLGLDQVKFMTMHDWKQLNSGSPAAHNLSRPTANNKRFHTAVSKFPYGSYPPPLLPRLASRSPHWSRGAGFSNRGRGSHFYRSDRGQPHRRGLESVSSQFTSRGRTYSNRQSVFSGSRRPYSQRFLASERSRESGFGFREPRYTSDRPQERRNSVSDRRKIRGR